MSKTALLGLTRALAPELAQSNIRVNCVAPGVIKTQFSSMVSAIHLSLCVCVYKSLKTYHEVKQNELVYVWVDPNIPFNDIIINYYL